MITLGNLLYLGYTVVCFFSVWKSEHKSYIEWWNPHWNWDTFQIFLAYLGSATT